MESKGADWKGVLIYYNADDKTEKRFNRGSLQNVKDYLGANYQLATVRLVKDPLFTFQVTSLFMYHLYIIMRTADKRWWFSLEKTGEGLVLQKSSRLDRVKYYRQGSARTWFNFRVIVICCDKTSTHIFDILDWLRKEGSLNDQYHFLFQNCKHFAKDAYDKIAKNDFATMFDGMGILVRLPFINCMSDNEYAMQGL